jgi:hypothetical protein
MINPMQGKRLLRLFSMFVAVAFSASAQVDAARFAAELRANYGPPHTRDVFTVPVGEMAVDYATSGHVCKIRLPAMAPEEGRPGVKSTKAVDDFLLKLLPLSMRGKELGKIAYAVGAPSVLVTQYENVTISEAFQGQGRTGVMVIFTNEKCSEPSNF